jgi:hypothetical protein
MSRFGIGPLSDPRIVAAAAGFLYFCAVAWLSSGPWAFLLSTLGPEVVAIASLIGFGFWAGWRASSTLASAAMTGGISALSAIVGAAAAGPIGFMLGWPLAENWLVWVFLLIGPAGVIGAVAGLAGSWTRRRRGRGAPVA